MEHFTIQDVVLGKGNGVNILPGNVRFRDLVNKYRQEYRNEPRTRKGAVAQKVIGEIQAAGGLFLEQRAGDGKFVEVAAKRAHEKTCQALREKPKTGPSRGRAMNNVDNGNSRGACLGEPSTERRRRPYKYTNSLMYNFLVNEERPATAAEATAVAWTETEAPASLPQSSSSSTCSGTRSAALSSVTTAAIQSHLPKRCDANTVPRLPIPRTVCVEDCLGPRDVVYADGGITVVAPWSPNQQMQGFVRDSCCSNLQLWCTPGNLLAKELEAMQILRRWKASPGGTAACFWQEDPSSYTGLTLLDDAAVANKILYQAMTLVGGLVTSHYPQACSSQPSVILPDVDSEATLTDEDDEHDRGEHDQTTTEKEQEEQERARLETANILTLLYMAR